MLPNEARIIGLTAQPEIMAKMIVKLETDIENIRTKETAITKAARLHRRRHYLEQHRYCNCEVCAALGE